MSPKTASSNRTKRDRDFLLSLAVKFSWPVVIILTLCLPTKVALATERVLPQQHFEDLNDNVRETTGASATIESARSKFSLPKLFDFSNYRSLFRKSYSSIVEELIREKIYLAHALKALVSAARYKLKCTSFYLRVNARSDRTKVEIEEIRARNKSRLSARERQRKERKSLGKLHVLELDSGLARDSPAGALGRLLRGKRETGTEAPAAPQFALTSFGDETRAPYDWFGQDDYSVTRVFKGVAGQVSHLLGTSAPGERLRSHRSLPAQVSQLRFAAGDAVYVDHRQSNCFFQPRDQGECGSCYAFAFVSALEWLYCRETGKLTPFSEQYIIDCGSLAGLNGCSGGDILLTGKFAHNFGLELRDNYPYKEREDECPYGQQEEAQTMGYLRVNLENVVTIKRRMFEKYIKFSPMLVGISTTREFEEYGGGVHNGNECDDDEDHVMLLIGHGREDGQDYWLLRNSYSVHWGEAGYYKLSKEADCIRTSGYMFGSSNGRSSHISPAENEQNNRRIVGTKHEQFLKSLGQRQHH